MKSTKTKSHPLSVKLSAIALAILATTPFAFADDAHWYGGASVGRSSGSIDDARITRDLLGRGFSTSSLIDNDRATGYKIYGGYQLNKYWGLEGGYFDLGNFGFKATTVPAGTLTADIKLHGVNLDVVGTLPITENFSVFGRVGANYAQATDTFVGTGMVNVRNPNPSQRATNLKLGLGLQYAFTESLSMRSEVERYRIDDAVGNKGDIDMVSIGLIYRFGAKEQPRAAYVAPPPQPMPIVMAPREETVVMVVTAPPPQPPPPPRFVPAPVVPRKVSFSADSLFDFNKASLRPTGQQHLDKFSADLKGTQFDVITVTGHTDRIGSHAYNMKLSTRRAETVKGYLVESAGIPAGNIVAKGVNGADPVTKPGECVGTKASPALIACLQPDRRVEVEVTGTR